MSPGRSPTLERIARSITGASIRSKVTIGRHEYPCIMGELWTSRQRQASSLHEISYRACYKPQLPEFFIQRLTKPGDRVYDPFSGRGTTAVQAGLMGRKATANDINPLSALLARPRFFPPDPEQIKERLERLPLLRDRALRPDLSMFYHPETERELRSLRRYLLQREKEGCLDHMDEWIRMVATNRLTGHSKGFLSVYTLPPNQAVTPDRQKLINKRLKQKPEYRNVIDAIYRKSRQLQSGLTQQERMNLAAMARHARFLNSDARHTTGIRSGSIALTVTSPPFLNIVNYASDNWLRCWFNGLDANQLSRSISSLSSIDDYTSLSKDVFRELYRVTMPGGYVCYEVGEVRKGTVHLEEIVIPAGLDAGFRCAGILINKQRFTKTAHIWGIRNNSTGTNTNRIVLFRRNN